MCSRIKELQHQRDGLNIMRAKLFNSLPEPGTCAWGCRVKKIVYLVSQITKMDIKINQLKQQTGDRKE